MLQCRDQFKTFFQPRCHQISMLLGQRSHWCMWWCDWVPQREILPKDNAHRSGVQQLKCSACNKDHSMHNPSNFWSSQSKACKHKGPSWQVLVPGTSWRVSIENLNVLLMNYVFCFNVVFSRVRVQSARPAQPSHKHISHRPPQFSREHYLGISQV